MILVARCLERIGDNTVDIAEQTVFVVTGLFREFADASTPSGDRAPRADPSRAESGGAASLSAGPKTVARPPAHTVARMRGTATPDRGVWRRRLLDRVGQHAARRVRAVADRRGAPARVLPAHRQRRRRPLRRPLLPGVLRPSRCEPSHISLFRRETGVGDPLAHLLAQDLVYVGGGSLVSLLGTWRAHGIDHGAPRRPGRPAW